LFYVNSSVKIVQVLDLFEPVVLFSSPCPNRWKYHKGGFVRELDMELWTEDEFTEASKYLNLEYPCPLYHDSYGTDVKEKDIENAWNQLDSEIPYKTIKNRTTLFGMVPRMVFGKNSDLVVGIDGLKNALSKINSKGINLKNEDEDRMLCHRLIHQDFDHTTRNRSEFFASPIIKNMIWNKTEKKKVADIMILLDDIRSLNKELGQGCFFEMIVDKLFTIGFSVECKTLYNEEIKNISFRQSIRKQFYKKRLGNFVDIFYDNISINEYFTLSKLDKPIIYSQGSNQNCATIDSFQIVPLENKVEINFIQSTCGNTHEMSPTGFFGMLSIISYFRRAYKTESPLLNFYFAVIEENFSSFSCNEVRYLKQMFPEMKIYIINISSAFQENLLPLSTSLINYETSLPTSTTTITSSLNNNNNIVSSSSLSSSSSSLSFDMWEDFQCIFCFSLISSNQILTHVCGKKKIKNTKNLVDSTLNNLPDDKLEEYNYKISSEECETYDDLLNNFRRLLKGKKLNNKFNKYYPLIPCLGMSETSSICYVRVSKCYLKSEVYLMLIHLFINISSAVILNDNDNSFDYFVKLIFSNEDLKKKAIKYLENEFVSKKIKIEN
jgi:hypothetical protein